MTRTPAPVAIAIMAKAPRAGQVKTRLCPPLSPEEAAALYRCFLADKIHQIGALARARPAIAFTPEDERGAFEALAPGFLLVPQRGPDLGSRLLGSLTELLHEEAAAVAVDSDTPTLPTSFLQQAIDLLATRTVDVVLGPTEDGGYYLIGVRAPHPALFEGIAWSTPAVLSTTLERARAGGLKVACLPAWFDVDTPADLARLRAALAAGSIAPARALLDRERLQAARPPSGANGLGELGRQPLALHLAGERLVVVGHRAELHAQIRLRREQRVADGRVAVVLGPSDRPDIHGVPPAGQRAVPAQPGMGDGDDVGVPGAAELLQEPGGRRALPQELVDLPGRAVTEQHPPGAELQP
jgi:rSAM/selenodomain-associated transferase 1